MGEVFAEAGRRVALIGAPLDAGAGRRGAVMGPAALRVAGIAEALAGLGHFVEDRGDVRPAAPVALAPAGAARNIAEIAGWIRAIEAAADDAFRDGVMPVLLGGDHSVAMGSVAAAAREARRRGRDLFVLWLDAHADFNTPETSPSGNVHGMALAALCGEPGLDGLVAEAGRVRVDPRRVHLLGIRQLDRGERRLLAERGVDVVDMARIDAEGVAAPLARVIEAVERADGVLHVSLDVDFLDPSLAPGVGTAVPGGATYREAHLVMERLAESGRVGSLDVVELNPFLDERGRSAELLVDLVGSLFGRRILERPARGRAAAAGNRHALETTP